MVYVYNRFQTKKSQELYTLCVLLLYGLYKGVPPPPRVLTTDLVGEKSFDTIQHRLFTP